VLHHVHNSAPLIRIQTQNNSINIKQLFKQYKQYNGNKDPNTKQAKNERKTLNDIREKLWSNNAVAVKADKGNSIIIAFLDDYHKRVNDFICNNNFSIISSDFTSMFQRKVRNTINDCTLTIRKDERRKYINLNPSAPAIRGLLKVHKQNMPIRPVVNWQNAPAYNLTKWFSKLLPIYIPLPYTFNIKPIYINFTVTQRDGPNQNNSVHVHTSYLRTI
jgi:hypothetical protein